LASILLKQPSPVTFNCTRTVTLVLVVVTIKNLLVSPVHAQASFSDLVIPEET
jgi:hypothetical protein